MRSRNLPDKLFAVNYTKNEAAATGDAHFGMAQALARASLHRLGGEGDGAREGDGLSLDGDEEVRAAGQNLRAHGASERFKPPRETHSLVAQHVAIRAARKASVSRA